MSETLILVRVRLHEDDVQAASAYAKSVQGALDHVDGFLGRGVWQHVDDELSRLIIFAYASPEAAAEGLRAVSARRTLIERQGHAAEPADVMGLRVAHTHGVLSRGVPHHSAISISIRVAEPGYGPELVEDYTQVFANLAAIPGYAGMAIAVNENLEEEVVGLVAWDDEGAFLSSLPRQPKYQVKLYEPVLED